MTLNRDHRWGKMLADDDDTLWRLVGSGRVARTGRIIIKNYQ